MNIKTHIKFFILILPLLSNLLINLVSGRAEYQNLVTYDLISTLLLFLFLFSIGYCFRLIHINMTVTIGIIAYLFSFYIIEIATLFFYKNMNIHITFVATNLLWFIYYLIYLNQKKMLGLIIFFYTAMVYFNNFYFNLMTINSNIEMDVLNVFFPHTVNIYQNSYLFSINNTDMQGYPQFMSYIDAILFKISIGLETYSFVMSNALVFSFLTLLLLFELKTTIKNKLLVSLLFITLLINSDWLQFLFSSSLMSEGTAGYLLAGILLTLFRIEKPNYKEKSFIFTLLGFIYLTKQFFSIIVLILFICFYFNKNYRRGSVFIFVSFLINQIAYNTYLSNIPKDHHIRQIDIKDTILDLILFRDLNLYNFLGILRNLFIDKPMTYLLILVMSLFLILRIKNKINFEINIYFFSTILNFLFIFVLYISAWREMELESPIRYIYSFLPMYLIMIPISLERLEGNN
tara:strand:+ start:10872 stop:12251 length:1380 start_codon:yes stop_codon:yes gene_type:complete